MGNQLYKKRHRELGLCTDCSRPARNHYCEVHNRNRAEQNRRIRNRWKAEGRCRHCGRSLEKMGSGYAVSSCLVCQDNWNEEKRHIPGWRH